MVSVSRGVAEPSIFLVVVADNGESIEKSSGLWRRAFVITVHQSRRRRKLAEGAVQRSQKQRVGRRPRLEEGERGEKQINHLTIVVITRIMRFQDAGGGP